MKEFLRIATWPVRFSKAFWQLMLNNGAFASLVIGLTILAVVSVISGALFVVSAANVKPLDSSLFLAGLIGAGFCGVIFLLCLGLCISVLAEKIDWKSLK
jgi:hypothetical protein